MQVKRTYGSRQNHPSSSSSTTEVVTKPYAVQAGQKRRTLAEVLRPSLDNIPTPTKRAKLSPKAITKNKLKTHSSTKPKQKALTQLHFIIDQTTLRTCPSCDLSYTKGAPEDESLHRSHCARVQKGMEWGREEERESTRAGIIEVASQVKLASGKRGRIISCPAECTGKIGSKMTALLKTINITLSSPPLTQECLQNSRIYLFLLPRAAITTTSTSSFNSGREKIVGCVVAQRIATAMAIASAETVRTCEPNKTGHNDVSGNAKDDRGGNPYQEPLRRHLVAIDSGSGLFCHPQPLPTPMGIPRLFVPSTFRMQGIASALLNTAAATFIHGCPLDPSKGQVAFTQPTGDGKAVMMRWGKGGARIYAE